MPGNYWIISYIGLFPHTIGLFPYIIVVPIAFYCSVYLLCLKKVGQFTSAVITVTWLGSTRGPHNVTYSSSPYTWLEPDEMGISVRTIVFGNKSVKFQTFISTLHSDNLC